MEPGTEAHACDLHNWDVEARGSGIQVRSISLGFHKSVFQEKQN